MLRLGGVGLSGDKVLPNLVLLAREQERYYGLVVKP